MNTITNIDKKRKTDNPIMVGFSNIRSSRRPHAGQIDKGADFFVIDGVLYCSHDFKTWVWPLFPKHIIKIMKREILNNPDVMKSLADWENLLPEDHVPRFIGCNFAGLDDVPDIDVDGNVHYTEFVDCKLRGTCRFEGKLCRALKVDNGVISGAEMAVLKLSNKPIKIIADELNISQETVKSHLKSIKDKTGLPDKTEVAIFAYKKALINE
ncbi:response regulator transcription factor [Parapedobacter soli]|uniref:response regulator transcription factor n=1 Tax=Parapedobacter soli TaxID=416955 RepID=UPI0021C798F6|nr:LuxR C-terminal-related transcriptional regulator [Parapedobacter soli]